MKKKLLLISCMVALLVCLFAITISAANEVTVITEDGTKTVDFEDVFNLKDGHVAGFKDSTVYGKDNIQDIIFPETVVGFNSSSKSLFKESTVIKSITFKGTSVDMNNSESMFQSSSIESVIFEQGHNCTLNVRNYTKSVFADCKSLTTIKFPTFTKVNSDGTSHTGDSLGSMFRDCTNMVAQNDIVFAEGVVSLGGQQIFENCSSLSNNTKGKCDVYFPSTIQTINHRSFRNTGITAIHFNNSSALTTIGSSGSEGTFSGCINLTSVDFSSCTNLVSLCTSIFSGCTQLTTVTGLEKTSVTAIPNSAFYKCTALTGTYNFSKITSVGTNAFRYAATADNSYLALDFPAIVTLGGTSGDTHVFSDSGVRELYFGNTIKNMSFNTFTNASKLWRVEFQNGVSEFSFKSYTFDNCTALKAFSIPDGITELPSRMFRKCTSLTAVYLPEALTAINSGDNDGSTFKECASLYFVSEPFTYKTVEEIPSEPSVYYFPSGLITMSGETFDGARLNDVVVFPSGLTSLTQGYTFEGSKSASGKPTVVFMGDMQTVTVKDWAVNAIYFCNKNDTDASSAGYSGSVTVHFCNAVENTTHLCEKTVSTEATCDKNKATTSYCFCGNVIETKEVEGTMLGHSHTIFIDLVYADFSKAGYYSYECEICGDVSNETTASALFICLGYSAPENGTGGIAIGFTVNNKAITEYKEVTGKSLKYGVFAVLKDRLGNNDIFGKDGKAAEGVISAAMTNFEFAAFEIKIVGFTDEYKDTKLAMGTYVSVTDGEATEYSYLQEGEPNENEKYCF
ncbi:MAG: leucine-rich repeat protein, partial [Clostridia bacterium]|nr:leucine-rich repeat protein [Clostridia bacterium]